MFKEYRGSNSNIIFDNGECASNARIVDLDTHRRSYLLSLALAVYENRPSDRITFEERLSEVERALSEGQTGDN